MVSSERPLSISILCILAFAGATLATLAFLIPNTRQVLIMRFGYGYFVASIVLTISYFIGVIGCWQMRKWGVYVITAAIIMGFVAKLTSHSPYNVWTIRSALGLLFPIVGFANLRKMT